MTITLILVVALMQIFNAAANTWRHGEAQVDAYREARGALQLMARDLSATLQASYVQNASATSAAVLPPSLPTLVLQRYPTTSTDDGPINEEVYCLTNIPNSGAISGMSSLCAVGYFCQWMVPDAPTTGKADNYPRAYALMRQSLNSNDTFQRLQAGPNPLGFMDVFSRDAPLPLTKTIPQAPTQLAAYIWDLRFRIDTDLNDGPQYVPDGNTSSLPGPFDHSTPPRLYGGDPTKPYPPRLPAYVEIRFKALSEIAGRRLEGPNTGVSKSTWNDTVAGFTSTPPYSTIIQPNAQQFVLRVPLINATPLPSPSPTQ